MLYTTIFVATTIILIAGLANSFFAFRVAAKKTFNSRFILAVTALALILVVLQIFVWMDVGGFGRWQYFIDLDGDRNLAATVSAVLWFLIGVAAMLQGLAAHIPIAQRLYWGMVGLIFIAIGLDDYYAIHELIIVDWRESYLIAGVIFGVVNLGAVWFWFRKDFFADSRPWLIMLRGLMILAVSGFFLEDILYDVCLYEDVHRVGLLCGNWTQTTSLEEIIENLAAVVLFAGLLVMVEEKLSQQMWQRAKQILVITAVVSPFLLLAYGYLLPAVEVRTLAHQTDIHYAETDLALQGYIIPQQVYHPGDRVYAVLYWEADTPPTRDYRLSAHLLTYPDGNSIAQVDRNHIAEIPTRGWQLPLTRRKFIHFDIPETIDSPGSYQIGVRVWYGDWRRDWRNTTGLTFTSADRLQLSDDMVVLDHITVIPKTLDTTTAQTTRYQFDGGFALSGVTIPATIQRGETATLQFAWQTIKQPASEYTQFIHLFHQESDAIFTLDRPPFDGKFLTIDWLPGIVMRDELTLALPDNLPAGLYDLRMGMYRTEDQQRSPVTDENGHPVTDASILLSAIELLD